MKKVCMRWCVTVLLVLTCFAVMGCPNGLSPIEVCLDEVGIVINLPDSNARSVYYSQSDAVTYTIYVSQGENKVAEASGNPGEEVKITLPAVGTYTVVVYASNSSSIVIAQGSVEVTLESTGYVPVTVQLKPNKQPESGISVGIVWDIAEDDDGSNAEEKDSILVNYPEYIDWFGTIENVYTKVDENGNAKKSSGVWTDDNGVSHVSDFYCYIGEYSSLNEAFLTYIENYGDYTDVLIGEEIQEGKYYINILQMMPEEWYSFSVYDHTAEDGTLIAKVVGASGTSGLKKLSEGKDPYAYEPYVPATVENYPEYIDLFGEVENVYADLDENGNIKAFSWDDEGGVTHYSATYCAEYTSMNAAVLAYYEGIECNAGSVMKYFVKKSDRYYLSFTHFYTATDSRYSIRLFDKNASTEGRDWKDIVVQDEDGIKKLAEVKNPSNNDSYSDPDNFVVVEKGQYPAIFENFGTLTNVFANETEDGNLKIVNPGNTSQYVSMYVAEYSELNGTVKEICNSGNKFSDEFPYSLALRYGYQYAYYCVICEIEGDIVLGEQFGFMSVNAPDSGNHVDVADFIRYSHFDEDFIEWVKNGKPEDNPDGLFENGNN